MEDNHEINDWDIIYFFGFMSTGDITIPSQRSILSKVYRHLIECEECEDKYYAFKYNVIKSMGEKSPILEFTPNFELLSQNEKLLENLIRN